MGLLILVTGLVLFLGMHAVRIPDEQRRAGMIARWGKNKYRGIYTVLSITGLVLIVYGYGQARLDPIFVWSPPAATRHIAALLMLFSMILLAACYVPMNHIKARLQHPMTLAVKVWALAHLLARMDGPVDWVGTSLGGICGMGIAATPGNASAPKDAPLATPELIANANAAGIPGNVAVTSATTTYRPVPSRVVRSVMLPPASATTPPPWPAPSTPSARSRCT